MFGLRLQRQVKTGQRSHANISLSGVSESVKLSDRVTWNSRRGITIRLGQGVSWHLGKPW